MSDKPIVDELEISLVTDDTTRTTPRRVPSGRPTKTKKTAPQYKEGALVEPLTKAYAAFALGTMPFAPMTANQIMQRAEECAQAWDEWAKVSPTVRRLLYPLLNVSGGAKVFAAHLPIAVAVMVETGAMNRFIANGFGDRVEEWLGAATETATDD